jgi:phosphatidylserine decarboxylase
VNRLTVTLQYLLPKRRLTETMGKLAAHRGGRLTTAVIRRFIAHYDVDMSEAVEPDPAAYPSFQDFFVRPLKEGARPLAEVDYVCPVDGAVSQLGAIERDQVFQAKGHRYSTTALLGGDAGLAAAFEDGSFATLYLSPRDYHRVHMPCDGRLVRMIYIPGDLFSVNPVTAQHVPGLFARNERLVCVFESAAGPFVLTFVGATVVGSIVTVWHGAVNAPRPGHVSEWHYRGDEAPRFAKGEEIGRFRLGSTVVLLFPPRTLCFNPAWTPERKIRMGEFMAHAAE